MKWTNQEIAGNLAISMLFFFLALPGIGYTQNSNSNGIYKKLIAIEGNSLSTSKKLEETLLLQREFNSRKLPVDSVYARLLHRLALYEYLNNNQIPTKGSITNTLQAIRINRSTLKGSNEVFSVNSYYNAATYYDKIGASDKALLYNDSTVIIGLRYPATSRFVLDARINKVLLYKNNGDYQKSIDESTIALTEARIAKADQKILQLFNQRALCKMYQGQLQSSLQDADSAIKYSKQLSDTFELSSAIKTQALVFEELKQFSKAEALFQKSVNLRITTGDFSQIADDYLDFGNYYFNRHENYVKAKQLYRKVLDYANDDEKKSKALSVLGMVSFRQNDYSKALGFYAEALQKLVHTNTNYSLINPTADAAGSAVNKDLVIAALDNKLELLIYYFKQTNNAIYIQAAVKTALLSDSLITTIRYQQLNDLSKLNWRKQSREIYAYAIEAAYLTQNNALAFFFMEKSRAVLLNDKLKELGASVHLPESEVLKEQQFRINLVTEQQKLSLTTPGSAEYNRQHLKLLNANDEFEHYIKSLEKIYPAYYQYKYADEVSSLQSLQQYLKLKQQSFIHYFLNDTVAYILSITPTKSELKKLSKSEFNLGQLSTFLQFCADRQGLDNNYSKFASISNALYKILFQPTNVPKGRVVICPDNFIIPFEALCTDPQGKNFLVYDYAFSYVYSARYLLTSSNHNTAKENFIGFAPVNFQASLDVQSLLKSGDALTQSASFYKSTTLLKNKNASRNNFLRQIGDYSIVNVFSHASADSTGSEPLLFMQDSVILLSELQLLNNPATQMVVLSACQTNVGKNATGEGIYSLARGFTSAGIPSVAATLWQADEETIYRISEKFHEYLSQGMSKDQALQKAKMDFMKQGHGKLLPYYWANMIIMGNAEPVNLTTSLNSLKWLAAAGSAILLAIIILMRRKLFPMFRNKKV